jgi:hypothetical protein
MLTVLLSVSLIELIDLTTHEMRIPRTEILKFEYDIS